MQARGKFLDWSDEEIEEISEISPADAEKAALFWIKHAPEEAKDILDAETEPLQVE